ncbi:hypothetical protein GQ53DRAFT_823701 [Thozetella sp. PMI_491]|nr:hypothetical protein GQ53DRAFT_823701 [Thozetella sp. PMI_491]
MANPILDALRTTQKETMDYFAHQRQGRGTWWWDNSAARAPVYNAFVVPKPGRWPGVQPAAGAYPTVPLHMNVLPNPARLRYFRVPPVLPRLSRAAERHLRREAGTLSRYEGLEFNRIIGGGGYGIVALYDITKGEFRGKQVVVKFQSGQPLVVQRERNWHQYFRKAKHIVQQMNFEAPWAGPPVVPPLQRGVGGRLRPNPRRRSRFNYNERRPIKQLHDIDPDEQSFLEPLDGVLVFEHLKRGSLATWIARMNTARNLNPAHPWFSNKQLWLMTRCLFRSIVSMQWPPSQQPFFNPNNPAADEEVPQPGGGAVAGPDIVHFDMDPTNFFVGDFSRTDLEHSTMPEIKLGDLGLVEGMDDLVNGGGNLVTCEQLWSCRFRGKVSILTPEQFIEEWDHINQFPLAYGATVAGHFGWHTNVYQFGLTLFSLITGSLPPDGPVDRQPIDNVPGQWGYGNYLLNDKWSHVDITLRQLAVDCLKENPFHRPQLDAIEDVIDDALAPANNAIESDQATRTWARNFFGSAPRQLRPPREALLHYLDRLITAEDLLWEADTHGER